MTIRNYIYGLAIIGLLFSPLIGHAQNGIIGTGFANGWSNPGDVLAFSAGLGNSRILTVTPNGTGNQYFRLVKFWNSDNSEFGPFGCADTDWSNQSGNNYDNMPICGGGAFYINCPNTSDNYVFKTADPDGDDFVYFRIEGNIEMATAVSQPTGSHPEGEAYAASVTISNAPSNGQQFYVRYSTDDFASSAIVPVIPIPGISGSAAPVTWVATIPGQTAGTTVKYYAFSAGMSAPTPTNADWFTINANTNGGANYQYDVLAPAPVTLSHFNAQARTATVQLNWSTESEENSSHFEIEKSIDGSVWKVIGSEAAAGQSSSRQDYNFADSRPVNGLQYYRLKQIDIDGSFEYSALRNVRFEKNKDIEIYPNPVTDGVLFLSGEKESWTDIIIYDANGRSVMMTSFQTTGVDVSHLSTGLYYLYLENYFGVFEHRKFTIQ